MGVVRSGYNLTGDHSGIQVYQGEREGPMGGTLLWLSLGLLPLDWNVTLTYLAEVQEPNQTSLIMIVNASLRFLSIEQNTHVRVEIKHFCNWSVTVSYLFCSPIGLDMVVKGTIRPMKDAYT